MDSLSDLLKHIVLHIKMIYSLFHLLIKVNNKRILILIWILISYIDKFDLSDFSYEESLNQNLVGHIFGVLVGEKTKIKTVGKDTSVVEHWKVIKNFGSQINKIMLLNNKELTKDSGFLINYNLGDKCKSDDKSNN